MNTYLFTFGSCLVTLTSIIRIDVLIKIENGVGILGNKLLT